MHTLISINNLSASYDGKQVLTDVSLNVAEHDFLGVIGPNGGGKTTLIKCILGLKQFDSGEVKFYRNNESVESLSMGYLPQYNLIDRKFPISVYEVILSGLAINKSVFSKYSSEDKQKAAAIVSRMGLEGLENRAIGQLSGGQLQRALLGRAIISEPQALILDEPNTYIDKKFQNKLYDLLFELQHECAIILVSHDIGSVVKQVQKLAYVDNTLTFYPDATSATKSVLSQQMGYEIL